MLVVLGYGTSPFLYGLLEIFRHFRTNKFLLSFEKYFFVRGLGGEKYRLDSIPSNPGDQVLKVVFVVGFGEHLR
jgi:hypothetical protein